MPKRLICVGPEQLAWEKYQEAPLAPDAVRIQAMYGAAKHGTEMAVYKGYGTARGVYNAHTQVFEPLAEGASAYPFRVGNMLVGHVTERGPEVNTVAVGDRVCLYSGFTETATVRADRCRVMPADMPWQTAVLLDPADFALGAVRDGQVRLGDAVAVFGMGAIGLTVLQMLRLAGARPIIAVEPLASRRAIAEALGADATVDPTACDAGLEIRRLTAGRGADVCIEYSGSRAAVQQALRGVAYGGTVVLGAYPPPYGAGLDLGAEAHHNIPNIVFTRACSEPGRDYPRWDNDRIYDACWALLAEGRLDGVPIVQPVVPFEDLLSAYPGIAGQPDKYLKLGVRFN
ncbi:MAG: zinc-binding alcohol dehydrogenase [Anaerolineae bacterium]